MATSRKQQTTEWIRDAARAEFIRVGPRALSLSSVAKGAFISTGAVYQRWPHREACIADIIETCTPALLESVCADWDDQGVSLATLVTRDLQDPERLLAYRFLAETVFAARDEPHLQPMVRQHLARWGSVIASRMPDQPLAPVLTWWVQSTWLGCALLRTSECPIPTAFDQHVVDILTFTTSTLDALAPVQHTPANVPDHPLPSSGRAPGDPTSVALVDATRQVISERGAHESDLRSVAKEAGVTTGAVYRRFSSRSELLVQAFVASLEPERYAWTRDFIAILESEGLDGAGDFWAGLCERIWKDEATAHLLLEFTVAAHTDEHVRRSAMTEIGNVAENREFLFSTLIEAGIIHPRHSAAALAWSLQAPTVGMRLLGSIGVVPARPELAALLQNYLFMLLFDDMPGEGHPVPSRRE